MKNIAILITKLTGGGAERAAANLSIELSAFYNVKIIVFDGENQTYSHGGELIDLKLPPRESRIGKLVNIVKRVVALKKIKKKYNIEHSISFLDGPNLINVLSKRNEKTIVSVRNFMSLSKKKNYFLTKILTKFILKRADKIVAVAKAIEIDLIKNYSANEHKTLTINNYCDEKRLMDLANQKDTSNIINMDEDNKYIVTAGRLTQQKGHWHLIRAYKRVVEKVPNSKLIILGEGVYKNKLIKLSRDLGLENNIIMPGYINNPHKIISKSHVFAFPSLYEGFSNALLEAMACKIAIVTSDCDSGSREIIAPDTPFDKKTKEIEFARFGIITPVCDYNQFNAEVPLTREEKILSNALIEMLTNESLRTYYAKNSRNRLKDFSPQIITERWRTIID